MGDSGAMAMIVVAQYLVFQMDFSRQCSLLAVEIRVNVDAGRRAAKVKLCVPFRVDYCLC